MNLGNMPGKSAEHSTFWQPDRALRGRGQWRCFGFALGALLAVLAAPGSGRVAWSQLGMSLSGHGSGMARMVRAAVPDRNEEGATAERRRFLAEARRADDLEAQVAYALTDPGPSSDPY